MQAPYNFTIFGWLTRDSCFSSVVKAFLSDSVSINFTATSFPRHFALLTTPKAPFPTTWNFQRAKIINFFINFSMFQNQRKFRLFVFLQSVLHTSWHWSSWNFISSTNPWGCGVSIVWVFYPLSLILTYTTDNNKTWEVPHTTPTFVMLLLFTLLYFSLPFLYDFLFKI